MRKILRILGKTLIILVAVIVLAIIIVPVAFKGKILDIARTTLNENLNAKADFTDVRISLIRSFPNLEVELDRFYIAGYEPFEKDTLVSLKSFRVALNPFGVIGKKGIRVKKIILDHPVIHAVVLENGQANWDIVPESTDTVSEPVDTAAATIPPVKVSLKKFAIQNGRITYDDRQGNMSARLNDLDFLLSGKFSGDSVTLDMLTTAGGIDVSMDGIRYMHDAAFRFTATLGADLENMIFTFLNNELSLNDLVLAFRGTVAMPDDQINVDIGFATQSTSFKSLLSMVPAVYKTDFQDLTATGNLKLDGYVRGQYIAADSVYPEAALNLKVQDAGFSYPGLPKSVSDVNIDVAVFADGTRPDASTVDVNRFDMKVGENPFHASLHISHPVSDPAVEGKFTGTIDLGTFNDVIPLDSTSMSGVITTDLAFGGTMSMLEKEQYDRFRADGAIRFNQLYLATPEIPAPVDIPSGALLFSPRYVKLNDFTIHIGRSDMAFSGNLENFIPWWFNDQVVSGNLAFRSHMMDVNGMMPAGSETEEADTLPPELALIEIPDRIDFVFTTSVDSLIFGNIMADRLKGKITVKDKKASLDGFALHSMGGNILVSGDYATVVPDTAFVDLSLAVNNIDIPSAYQSLVTLQRMASFADGMQGKVSLRFSLTASLDKTMMPVLTSINSKGRLQSKSLQLVSGSTFDKIRNMLKLNEKTTNTFKDLDIGFEIVNGNIILEPFKSKLGDIPVTMGGEIGLDKMVNYDITLDIPRKYMGSQANEAMNNLFKKTTLDLKAAETIPVVAKVTGPVNKPQIKLDLSQNVKATATAVKEAVKEKVEAEVEQKKEEVKIAVDAEKEKLRQEANARADAFLEEAGKRRDEMIRRAELEKQKAFARADSLEKNASGTILDKIKIKAQAEAIRKAAAVAHDKTVRIANDKYKKAGEETEKIRKSWEKK
ncbi:MAG: AsmA family protein [Chlorobi bacterium]|nr:AsmA family protein [Chlorobiota bacterium]